MIKVLARDQFLATFVEPMRRLGAEESLKTPPVGEYADACMSDLDPTVTRDQLEIQHVYLNGNQTFAHILIFFGRPNVYLVIVIDREKDEIRGHFVLDLNEEYGLNRTPSA